MVFPLYERMKLLPIDVSKSTFALKDSLSSCSLLSSRDSLLDLFSLATNLFSGSDPWLELNSELSYPSPIAEDFYFFILELRLLLFLTYLSGKRFCASKTYSI